ncbi:MAG: adenosine deaminase [Pseudobdellovibrionaceae bacterium]
MFTNGLVKFILFSMNFGQSNSSYKDSLEALQLIPKVELHRHLECSMRLSTFVELAEDLGLEIPSTLEKTKEEFLVTSPMRDLESVLQKFLRTQAVLSSPEILSRITYEAIEDASLEGIKILELRWAPTFIAQGHPHLNFDKILDGIRKGAQMASHLPVAVGFLSIIQRILPVSEAEKVVDFTIDHKDFFIGLDLADNEEGFDPRLFQKPFEKAKKNGLHITVHAGEAKIPQAAQNVKNSIQILGAQRIGHGLQIISDPSIVTFVREQGIPLELCVTSNWLTQAIPNLQDHPIRKLMQSGVLVTINSDDPGIFDSNLLKEYQLLAQSYGFTAAEFDQCNDVAAQASFLPLMKKQSVWPRPIHTLR